MVGCQEKNCFTALGSQEWQDIYKENETVEETEGFKVGVELNQRSAMSPFFLASVMDKLKDGGQAGVCICSNVRKCHCDV